MYSLFRRCSHGRKVILIYSCIPHLGSWERARGEGGGGWLPSQTGNQPCDHPCGCPDRQHAMLAFTPQVNEVSASLLRDCAPPRDPTTETKTELKVHAAGWTTDASLLWQARVVCLKSCPSPGTRMAGIIWAEGSPTRRFSRVKPPTS